MRPYDVMDTRPSHVQTVGNIGIFSLLCLTLVSLSGETKALNGKRKDVCDTPIEYLYACKIWPAQVDG